MGANIRTYKTSFNGGELTPEFFGQIGDAKFQTGLALCRKVVESHGGTVTIDSPGGRGTTMRFSWPKESEI